MKQKITFFLFASLFVATANNVFGQSSITSTSQIENESTDYTFTIVTDGAGVTWNFVDVYAVAGSSLPSFPGNEQPSNVSSVDVFIDDSPTEAAGYLRNLGGYIRFDHYAALPIGTKITMVIKGVGNPSAASNLETKVVFNTGSGNPITTYTTTMDIITEPAQSSITSTSQIENESTDYTFTIVTDGAGVTWNFVDVYAVAGSSLPSFPGNEQPSNVSSVDVFIDDSPTEAAGYLRNLGGYIRFDHYAALPIGTKITMVIKGVGNPSAASNLETKVVFNTGSGNPITTYTTTMDIMEPSLSIDNDKLGSVKLYPTITSNKLYINGAKANTVYAIYDIGTVRQIMTGSTNGNINEIDVKTISSGMYLIKLSSGNDEKTFKFIKN